MSVDKDVIEMTSDQLQAEVMKLRTAIRAHRDSKGHDLCWHVPELWATLPEAVELKPETPEPCEFIENCVQYRMSLEKQEEIEKAVKKLKDWLATDEGKASLKAAGEKATKAVKEMEERCRVTDEMLRMRVTI